MDSLHRTGYTAGLWGFKKPLDTFFSETYKVGPVFELSLKCSYTAPPNAGPMSGAWKAPQDKTERGITCGRSQFELGKQGQAWKVSELAIQSPVRLP